MRPLLANDEEKESMSVVQYPTSTELQGDGIELLQTTGKGNTVTTEEHGLIQQRNLHHIFST